MSTKTLVTLAQTVLWLVFMSIDASVLIPALILRYFLRAKSEKEIGRRTQKTVVIVGGNFSGLAALREFQNNALFSVILIDQRDYFEYTPGILRLFCEPNKIHELAYELPKGSHQIIKGTVTRTWNSHVTYVDATTRKQQSIAFDYLILATGSTYTAPITPSASETSIAARVKGWKAAAKRVQESSSILILGGGAVGTELAAEIADYYKDGNRKSITLVDASPILVPMFAPDVSEYAERWMRSHGVRLVLGQMLETWDDKSCKLKNGKVLRADLVFVCFGDKPNSSPLTNASGKKGNIGNGSPPPVKFDPKRCVKVDAFLRAEGRRNVFCCGDVSAPPTEGVKQGFHAEVQGHLAAENVIRLASGQRFKRYPEDAANGSDLMPLVYVLSLGKWDGVIGFNSLCIPGPLAPIVKWIIEWTKVRQMLGRPIGTLIWKFGDAITFFLSKHFLRPIRKEA
jgi:NADH dehydrogenase FAD-containing subunit